MREVVVVDAVRTPIDKGHPEKGIYTDVLADDLVIVAGGVEHMGHIPIGKGLTATLLHELQRRGARFGLATMCIGFGQWIATIFERA